MIVLFGEEVYYIQQDYDADDGPGNGGGRRR
jgi:hypothetical protein